MSRDFILDANVLYSARLRDLGLQLTILQVARIVMTDAIELEWMTAITRRRPDLLSNIARTAQLIRSRMPEVYLPSDALSPLTIALPDPNDLHVVQAAIANRATIVTFNI